MVSPLSMPPSGTLMHPMYFCACLCFLLPFTLTLLLDFLFYLHHVHDFFKKNCTCDYLSLIIFLLLCVVSFCCGILFPINNSVVCVCVCICYWTPVWGVCPNYEVVEFQHWTETPPKPRLRQLLLHSYS